MVIRISVMSSARPISKLEYFRSIMAMISEMCIRDRYTVVLMQGSGTFGVEAVLTSVIANDDKLLIIANGAYGERMADIAAHAGICHVVYNLSLIHI